MRKVTPITEQFQHFVQELKDSFWGDVYGKTKLMWKQFWEEASLQEQRRYLGYEQHERGPEPKREYRNGFYWRSFETLFGTIRLRIARSRRRGFLPRGIEAFQRRAPELALLIREAFLRGISTRQVGQVIASLKIAPVSAQTVFQADPESGPGSEGFPPTAFER
jgi:putative transposase